jgi:hypothetical protein
VIVPVPPVDANWVALLAAAIVHAAALCRMVARWPLTTTALSRGVPFGLGAARNSTLPLPWPCVGAMSMIHVASDDAVQAHSGCVVTVIAPVPPAASSSAPCAVTATWHLSDAGPVTDTVDVEPQPETMSDANSREPMVEHDRIVIAGKRPRAQAYREWRANVMLPSKFPPCPWSPLDDRPCRRTGPQAPRMC